MPYICSIHCIWILNGPRSRLGAPRTQLATRGPKKHFCYSKFLLTSHGCAVDCAYLYSHPQLEEEIRMSKEKIKAVDEALSQVSNGRRSFLKGLLIGSATLVALPLMKSKSLAQDNDNAPKKKKKKKGGDNDNM